MSKYENTTHSTLLKSLESFCFERALLYPRYSGTSIAIPFSECSLAFLQRLASINKRFGKTTVGNMINYLLYHNPCCQNHNLSQPTRVLLHSQCCIHDSKPCWKRFANVKATSLRVSWQAAYTMLAQPRDFVEAGETPQHLHHGFGQGIWV